MRKKLIRKGLELLKQIDKKPKILENIIQENKFPPKMLMFLANYKVGFHDIMFLEETYPYGKLNTKIPIALYTADYIRLKTLFDGEEYTNYFFELLNYEELIIEYKEYENITCEWHDNGFIKIGFMAPFRDLLLLGVEEENKDEIWRFGEYRGPKTTSDYFKFDDNIFDFMSRLEQYWSDKDLKDKGIDSSLVYKNWGEDFWRVREDKEV